MWFLWNRYTIFLRSHDHTTLKPFICHADIAIAIVWQHKQHFVHEATSVVVEWFIAFCHPGGAGFQSFTIITSKYNTMLWVVAVEPGLGHGLSRTVWVLIPIHLDCISAMKAAAWCLWSLTWFLLETYISNTLPFTFMLLRDKKTKKETLLFSTSDWPCNLFYLAWLHSHPPMLLHSLLLL